MMKKLIFICYFFHEYETKYVFKERKKKINRFYIRFFFYIVLKKMLPRPFDILQNACKYFRVWTEKKFTKVMKTYD